MTPGTLFKQTRVSLSKGCSMLNMIPFGAAVFEEDFFNHFPVYHYVNV